MSEDGCESDDDDSDQVTQALLKTLEEHLQPQQPQTAEEPQENKDHHQNQERPKEGEHEARGDSPS